MTEIIIVYIFGCVLTALILGAVLMRSPLYMHPLHFAYAILLWPAALFWFIKDTDPREDGDE